MSILKFRKSFFNLTLIFVVSAAVIFFLMGLTYKHLEKLSEYNHWMNHSLENSLKIEKLYSEIRDLGRERRNYILTRDRNSKSINEQQKLAIKKSIEDLRIAISDNPRQLQRLKKLEMLATERMKSVDKILNSPQLPEDTQSVKNMLMDGHKTTEGINKIIEEMLDEENRLFVKRKDDFAFAEKSTPLYTYVLALFSLGLLGYAFFRIYNEVKKQKRINTDLQLMLNTANLAENIGKYGVWIYNFADGNYTFSENHYRILGYQPNAVQASRGFFLKHTHPDDLQMVEEEFAKKHSHNSLAPFTFRILRHDGQERTLQITAKKIGLEGDDQILLGITTDITEEIKNKEDLKKAYKELLFYNESTKEAEKIGKYGFWRWNVGRNEFFFSDNIFKIFGYEPGTTPHHLETFLSCTHPDDLPYVLDKMQQMREKKKSTEAFTHRIYRKNDGALRYIRVTSKMISDQQNGNYYLVILQDITEEVLAKQKMEENSRNLEASNKELQSFNYIASHDLQEPLRKIETFISRLEDKEADKFSETGRKYFERMKFSSRRMRKLIDDLLQFSRTSRNENVFEKVDFNMLMENAMEDLQQKIEEKNATVTYTKMPDLMVVPFQIQQLFSNLIGNSLKYSRPDVPPQITVNTALVNAKEEELLQDKNISGNYYKFIFEDNGIGFEEEFEEKVFDLFTRLHGKTEYEGTGIGLAICKKIVENHHGFIFAKGNPGQGAVFTVYLPAKN